MDRFALEGRLGLVTGAASGLGKAAAEVLAEAGATVVLTDIDQAGLNAVADAITDAGGRAECVPLDVSDRPAIRTAIDDVVARHGRLDVVVASAGITAGPSYRTEAGRIEAIEDTAWDTVVAVNLSGVFATVQAASRHMKSQGDGRIVVVASVAGLKSDPMVGYAYAATKSALVNLVRQAAMELAPHGVLINAVAPGPFRTNIAGGRIRQPEIEAAFSALVPLGRIADPEEIKGLMLLLASPASSFMTGTTIPIDGGMAAR
ncbi:SDR family oxidoreductase [Amorphus sp. 3PC139-8]